MGGRLFLFIMLFYYAEISLYQISLDPCFIGIFFTFQKTKNGYFILGDSSFQFMQFVNSNSSLRTRTCNLFPYVFFIKHNAAKECLTNIVLWVIMRALQIIFAFNFYNIIARMNKVLNYFSTTPRSFSKYAVRNKHKEFKLISSYTHLLP